MTLAEYLDGMRAAATADELEAAIQAPHVHRFRGRTWSQICKVRIEAGQRICEAHPNGRYVPRLLPGRRLVVCGEEYRVGRGQNATGVRYVWHSAQKWAESVLIANGFSRRAAYLTWDGAFDYPHRALRVIENALAGRLPDPRFNRLVYRGRSLSGKSVRVDRRYEEQHRAHRPCKCGGWLWDWGCGWTGYSWNISWRCDGCSRVYSEDRLDLDHRRAT